MKRKKLSSETRFAGVTAILVALLLSCESSLWATDVPRSAEPNVIFILCTEH